MLIDLYLVHMSTRDVQMNIIQKKIIEIKLVGIIILIPM